MLVLIASEVVAEELGELPAGVELQVLGDPPDPAQLARAEVVVPAYGSELVRRLGEMPALRLVVCTSAGYEWLEPHVPPGVALVNARGARDAAVAEWVLAVILAMEKELFAYRDAQRAARWAHRLQPDLEGRRVLILGAGSIGGAVESRLAPFGVEIARVARRACEGVHDPGDLPDLLARTDILVVLLPGAADTRGLVGADLLSRLPDGALVVNAGRGSVVDTDALLGAVRTRGLRAALDVTEPEPLPAAHPLWREDGVFITPHLAGDSPRSERAAHRLAGDQLRAFVAGEPIPNEIDRRASGPGPRS